MKYKNPRKGKVHSVYKTNRNSDPGMFWDILFCSEVKKMKITILILTISTESWNNQKWQAVFLIKELSWVDIWVRTKSRSK